MALLRFITHPLVLAPLGISGVGFGFAFIRNAREVKHYDLDEQEDKTFIVTGATSGIGRQLAHKLALKNATVIMACRNKNKCLEARRDIVLQTRNKKVFCRICDLSDPESVHNFAYKLTKDETQSFEKIDGIILNAGTKIKKYTQNKQGIETSLATNHFGNFLLVGLLLQKLLEQETASKIIFVGTDIAAKDGLNLDLNALNDGKFTKKLTSTSEIIDPVKGKYDMHAAYKYSKLMQLLFAKELAERLKDTHIRVVVADPGGTKTDLNKDEPSQKFFLTRWTSNFLGYVTASRKIPRKAVYPIFYALGEEEVKNGSFINSRRVQREWGENAENTQLRQKVWLMSEQWTKLAEYMGKMEQELGKPGYFSNDPHGDVEEEKRTRQRSAKYLWLA
ncbi:hypothetical protein ACQ4LE_005624 [Meloidogyne hapla]